MSNANFDVDAARTRIKRRSGAFMSFVIGPVILLVAWLKFFERHDYPAGDIRNDPLLWGAIAIVATLFVLFIVAMSIRELRVPRAQD